MDAVPFRQFLSSKVYASEEDLSEAVGRDKGADEFCRWLLHPCEDWRRRRSIGDYIQQGDRRSLNCLPTPWFCTVEPECFNIWCVLHKRCRPKTKTSTSVHPPVVCNNGAWLTWVNVLTMYPHLPFKHKMCAQFFGSP